MIEVHSPNIDHLPGTACRPNRQRSGAFFEDAPSSVDLAVEARTDGHASCSSSIPLRHRTRERPAERKAGSLSDRTVLPEDAAYDVLAYLIASAETLLVEPSFYGPRRLIDAAAQLAEAIAPQVAEDDRVWLSKFVEEAGIKSGWARRDPDGFAGFLKASSIGVARELKRRAAVNG
jgi:hypothetical protein